MNEGCTYSVFKNTAVVFDKLLDTVFINFTGRPEPTIGMVLDNGVVLRVRPGTDEVVGIEIPQASYIVHKRAFWRR